MKKNMKYKIRRLIFLYFPIIVIFDVIFIIMLVQSGIYVI